MPCLREAYDKGGTARFEKKGIKARKTEIVR